jgi:tetratricopeptide (TPR) repeat protein
MMEQGRILLCAAALLLLLSCLTDRPAGPGDFSQAVLLGIIYDYDNTPCAGASVILDGGEDRFETDINGRFAIPLLARGEHTIAVKKQSYEELSAKINFTSRDQILYLKVFSIVQLLRMLEQELARKRFKEAEELIKRVEAIRNNDPVGLYLKAVYLLEKGQIGEARDALEQIIGNGYREPIVFLTLADICEERLGDNGKAAEYLGLYLELRRDPAAEARLEELVKKQSE